MSNIQQSFGKPILVALIYAMLAWGGITLATEGRIADVWLSNGFLLAVMMRSKNHREIEYFAAAFVADVIVNLTVGDNVLQALILSAGNCLEVLIVLAGTFYVCGRKRSMTNLKHLCWFMGFTVIAPAISAIFVAITINGANADIAKLWPTWQKWEITDALGMLISVPFVLTLYDAWTAHTKITQRKVAEWAILGFASIIILIAVFFQNKYPFLFIIFPLAPIFAFRLGNAGTAILATLVATVAAIATSLGKGPIAMMAPGLDKIIVFQTFVAVCFVMGLTIAAALEARDMERIHLRKQKEFSGSMLENMREVIFRTNNKDEWIFLNHAWENLTGYTVKQSLGWKTTRLLHPDEIETTIEKYTKLIKGEVDELMLKQRFYNANNECHYIEVSAKALRNENGDYAGAIGNIRDITLQEQASQALAEREAELELLAENATDAVFRLDLDGLCLYASPSAKQMIGSGPISLVGLNMINSFHPDDNDHMLGIYNQLRKGEIDNIIATYRSKAADDRKDWLWLEANCGLVRDADGNPSEIITSIRDVAQRKKLEGEIEEARTNAEQAASAKTTFLANMSHEIRTPMNGVIGFADLLLANGLNEDQRHQVQMIADSGRTMMRLLNDILDLSKVEAGQMTISREPVDLRHVFNGCVRLIEPSARQNNLELNFKVADDIPESIIGDGLRLRQILLNLLSNAVKFTEQGVVSVDAITSHNSTLEIIVSDSGIGINSDRLKAIFEPFRQAEDGTAKRFGGTGLGLTISAQLAKLMGGTLTVKSQIGLGTKFILTIPLEISKAKKAKKELVPKRINKRSARILLAEDHDVNQTLFLSMLKHLGHHAELAIDGAEAVAMALTAHQDDQNYDIVLMDLQMPVVDGLAATRLIRTHGISPEELPIIALTANAYSEDVARCLEAGMQAHLAKPVQLENMVKILDRWLPVEAATHEATLNEKLAIPDSMMATYIAREHQAKEALIKLASMPTPENLAKVADQMHKIAGTAAMFGRPEIGNIARHIEDTLVTLENIKITPFINHQIEQWQAL